MADVARVEQAIFVDEIGLAYARLGAAVVKTAFAPVLAVRPEGLVPVAVEGQAHIVADGRTVAATALLAALDAPERRFLATLWQTLHVRNHGHLGVEGLGLFLRYALDAGAGPDPALRDLRLLAGHMAEAGVEPARTVCELTGMAGLAPDDEAMLVEAVRAHGLALALGADGPAERMPALIARLRPDLVRLDGGWLARLDGVAPALRMLGTLVAMLQDDGAEVLVDAIATPRQLATALDCGADLVCGPLFGPARPAGALFDPAPRDPQALVDPSSAAVRRRS
ncbi:EAL domain-containing protein [Aquibium sp. A9E412]|uniref:EAL domain-containing protein n=1 Tax=Aquibium sp. A9E412 TaxID=2976767 RepID=UPI0025AFCB70|nr:EAL domain-containing protein [Aquibium sp. A9E412]MDN2565470.1 EAL domain-containing protein [Aquibium sp. A9E412]